MPKHIKGGVLRLYIYNPICDTEARKTKSPDSKSPYKYVESLGQYTDALAERREDIVKQRSAGGRGEARRPV
jgi:3-hydroxy-3-methylglutaryl CoA synthase